MSRARSTVGPSAGCSAPRVRVGGCACTCACMHMSRMRCHKAGCSNQLCPSLIPHHQMYWQKQHWTVLTCRLGRKHIQPSPTMHAIPAFVYTPRLDNYSSKCTLLGSCNRWLSSYLYLSIRTETLHQSCPWRTLISSARCEFVSGPKRLPKKGVIFPPHLKLWEIHITQNHS